MKGAKQFFVFAASRFALAAFLNPEKNGDSCDYPALKLPHLRVFLKRKLLVETEAEIFP